MSAYYSYHLSPEHYSSQENGIKQNKETKASQDTYDLSSVSESSSESEYMRSPEVAFRYDTRRTNRSPSSSVTKAGVKYSFFLQFHISYTYIMLGIKVNT